MNTPLQQIPSPVQFGHAYVWEVAWVPGAMQSVSVERLDNDLCIGIWQEPAELPQFVIERSPSAVLDVMATRLDFARFDPVFGRL